MDDYTFETEPKVEEGWFTIPDITIRFFEDANGSCIETIENAQGYPIPHRKDYICLPSHPEDYYKVRNVVDIYEPDGHIVVEVFVSWVDILSLEL